MGSSRGERDGVVEVGMIQMSSNEVEGIGKVFRQLVVRQREQEDRGESREEKVERRKERDRGEVRGEVRSRENMCALTWIAHTAPKRDSKVTFPPNRL